MQDIRPNQFYWTHLIIAVFNIQKFDNWCADLLKGLAQAEIIKKSVILFWLFNMTKWSKHVLRLELQKFFLFFVLRI